MIGVTTIVLAAIMNAIAPDNIRLPNLLPVIKSVSFPLCLPEGFQPVLERTELLLERSESGFEFLQDFCSIILHN